MSDAEREAAIRVQNRRFLKRWEPEDMDVLLRQLDAARAEITKMTRKRDEAEYHLANSGVVEIGARNVNVSSYCNHWEHRAAAAEARVADLREAIQRIIDVMHEVAANALGQEPPR